MKYGIYDTKDGLWIGTEEGPNAYDEEILARICAQVIGCRVTGSELETRFEARPLPEDGFHLRDSITPKLDAVTAIRRVEGDR